MPSDDFIVTPWNVEGDIDYEKLIKRFGTEKITPELISKIDKFTNESDIIVDNYIDKVFNLLKDDGFLVTYCAKGIVKRTMEFVGFEIFACVSSDVE